MNPPLEPKAEIVHPRTAGLNHHAFTLVELLTVIALIAVLAAVRWSALTHTTNRSQLAVDFYNHKQLLAAVNMYAADHNEILPGNGWGTSSDCWAHKGGMPGGPVATLDQMIVIRSNQIEYCKLGQLFPYVRNERLFVCPADIYNAYFFQRVVYFTSYGWNGSVSGYGNLDATGAASYKITRFKPNSILQWEQDDLNPFYFNDCSMFPDEGISGRHGISAPVGLISGGTERIPLKLWYSNAYAGGSGNRGGVIPAALLPNQLWCNPGTRFGMANQ